MILQVPGLVTAVKEMGLEIDDQERRLAENAGAAVTLTTSALALLSILICVLAAVNIAHALSASVRARAKEIGVMQAVGASRSDVRNIVLAEAGVVGLAGGAIGTAVALLLALGINRLAARYLPDFPSSPTASSPSPGRWCWAAWRSGSSPRSPGPISPAAAPPPRILLGRSLDDAPSRKILLANAGCLLLLALRGGCAGCPPGPRRGGGRLHRAAAPRPPPAWCSSRRARAGGLAVGPAARRGTTTRATGCCPSSWWAHSSWIWSSWSVVSPGLLELASLSLQSFQKAQQLATADAVPAEPAVLSPLLEKLGRPPYLVRGQPASQYTLLVRQDCEGPVRSAPGLQPGTLIYRSARPQGCLDHPRGASAERRFGAPDVVSVGGEPRFLLVEPVPPSEGQDARRDP